jgi:endoglucanase Acf2
LPALLLCVALAAHMNNSVNSNPMYAKFREFKMFIGADAWAAGVNGPNDLRAQVKTSSTNVVYFRYNNTLFLV